MTTNLHVHLADEAATLEFAAQLAARLEGPLLVYLHGELGAGKTTLVRGILRAMGHRDAVKSPTYTLLEPYDVDGRTIYHFDLYRVGDGEELDFIGIDELMDAQALKLVEWPERAGNRLPEPDVVVTLSRPAGGGRDVDVLFSA